MSEKSVEQQTVPNSVQSDLSRDLSNIQALIEQYNKVESFKSKLSDIKSNSGIFNNNENYTALLSGVIDSHKYGVVIENFADIKQSANFDSETIARLPKGAIFLKTGEDAGFYQVDVSGKMGWLPKTSVVQPQFVNYDSMIKIAESNSPQSVGLDSIISGLIAMRDKWKNNEYIEVEGFDISLGLPLSVNFSFKFR